MTYHARTPVDIRLEMDRPEKWLVYYYHSRRAWYIPLAENRVFLDDWE